MCIKLNSTKCCSLKEIFDSVYLPQLLKIVEHNEYSTFFSTLHSTILFLFYFSFFFLVGWGLGWYGCCRGFQFKSTIGWATVNVPFRSTNGPKTKWKRTCNYYLLQSKLFKKFRRTS